MEFLIFSVHILGISSILNSINVLCTIYGSRVDNYFTRLSLFVLLAYLTSILLVMMVPVLAVAVNVETNHKHMYVYFGKSFTTVNGGKRCSNVL